METLSYKIPNISCGHCIKTIQNELSEISGVHSVEGDPQTKEIKVSFSSPASSERILEVLKEINYLPI
jgi:copper chaperone CopZ